MFSKLLIANRGEIAVRVIRTAKRLGVQTVAVYSEADEDALHVRMADEAVLIGPPPALESYLRIDRILEAVEQTKAEAVHPGYGFLSENREFVEALDTAGVVFVGPPAPAIASMGDKIESKRIASEAGVSTIPGHGDAIPDADEAVRIASEIGYPVMIKAAAGGGGKGMRIARDEREAREGYESSRSEARSSFGDDRVFVEKFVVSPRHIEIQVLADKHGNAVYLGERDCSVQRRNQKVVEEAPSPFLDSDTRRKMGEQAVGLALAVGYHSAGTVEFVVDSERNFYFLEMNTRLQVEHPVTELVYGVDLVEQMLMVAAGERLDISQEDIKAKGWALEARLYAEDPFRGFLPSIGRITRYAPPAETGGVRIDAGVVEGSEVSLHYDPMIAKLCTSGEDRDSALAVMRDALDSYEISGIGHNIPFLSAVFDHPSFVSGDFNTGFIEAVWPEGFSDQELADEEVEALVAVCAILLRRLEARAGRERGYLPPTRWVASVGGREMTLDAGERSVAIGEGPEMEVEADWTAGRSLCRARVAGKPLVFHAEVDGEGFRVRRRATRMKVTLRSERRAELARLMPAELAEEGAGALRCPMPGLVVSIAVDAGDKVEAGQPVATVEAMKMENVLRAERTAVVARVVVAPGDTLAVDDVVVEYE